MGGDKRAGSNSFDGPPFSLTESFLSIAHRYYTTQTHTLTHPHLSRYLNRKRSDIPMARKTLRTTIMRLPCGKEARQRHADVLS